MWKLKIPNLIIALIIYVMLYFLIGFAVYITKSAWPLVFLIFSPNIRINSK